MTMSTMKSMFIVIFAVFLRFEQAEGVHYEPNWKSLDSRPLPSWYDESKIGIFIHWGVFSVPSFGSEWFWYNWKGAATPGYVEFMKENYRPDFTYADFAPQFTTEFYDALEWAKVLKNSGARYVVLVSKHHEGYTNWPSNHSWNWNSKDVGPNRDLVGELAGAIRLTTDMHFGLYHSLFEWFNPLFLKDQENNYTTQEFVRSKTLPELHEIVEAYSPEIVWSDGDWMTNDTYWNATEFLAWLYNDSPVKDFVVVNDRWGKNIRCKHGGFFNCDDRFNPGILQKHKWENAMTIDKYSWGYRRNTNLRDYLTMDELLDEVAKTISCGGNILINIGPTHDGRIIPIFQERLLQLGEWLKVNGEAIYSSVPWTHQNDTVALNVWYTSKAQNSGKAVYAIISDWPTEDQVYLAAPEPSDGTTVQLLGRTDYLTWNHVAKGGIMIKIPSLSVNDIPCKWSWVFKFEGLNN